MGWTNAQNHSQHQSVSVSPHWKTTSFIKADDRKKNRKNKGKVNFSLEKKLDINPDRVGKTNEVLGKTKSVP